MMTHWFILIFIIRANGKDSVGKIVIILVEPLKYSMIDANNINALIAPAGNHFWDLESAYFEAPKGSGKNAVFCSTLWMGGLTDYGQLHLAGEKYRLEGADFSPGPISLQQDSTEIAKWLPGTWNLNQSDIDYHINNWNKNGFVPNKTIIDWPAIGNPSNGQMGIYAPFHDRNNNRKYEPLKGDYPIIRGDQSVFFIMNDSMILHAETKGIKIGIEVLGMAYAFSRPENPVLNNTLFLHYDIVNRSSKHYHDVYLGLFFDPKLGYAYDDRVGTDVTYGMIYCYNGDDQDGSGESWAYGDQPPAVSLKIIGGPYMAFDGLDIPKGQCHFDINGLNFEDGVIDNERLGLTGSIYYHSMSSGFSWYMVDPSEATQYYKLMKILWLDGTHLSYGGLGHESTGAVGPDCYYMWPGTSDTLCNWDTRGLLPNGEFNQNGYYWSEETSNILPYNRNFLASIGPFTLAPGESIPLDLCYIFVQAEGGAMASRDSLINAAAYIQKHSGEIIAFNAQVPYGIKDVPEPKILKVSPNPVHENLRVINELSGNIEYSIYDFTGRLLMDGILTSGYNHLDVSKLKPGIYLIKAATYSARIVVY